MIYIINKKFSFFLQGQYVSQIFQFLKIRVAKCDDSNKSWDYERCATDLERDQFIKQQRQYRISIFHSNYSFKLNHKDSFNYQYLNEELSFTFIPGSVYKYNDIFFKHVIVKNDENNLITQSFEKSEYIIQEYRDIKEYFSLSNQDGDYSIFFLRRSADTIQIRREFQKFSTVMIQFGGLIKFIITFAGFFVTKYNSFLFTIELANKLYNFNFGNNNQNKNINETLDKMIIAKNSNDPPPQRIKSISMLNMKNKDQISEKNMSTSNIAHKNSILNTLNKKCNSQNSQAINTKNFQIPSLTDIDDLEKAKIKENQQNQYKLKRLETLEKINEQLSNSKTALNQSQEQPNKVVKENPIQNNIDEINRQKLAQKFQHLRKDSVRQLQIFQENIQNQYFNNIKKKKQSIQLQIGSTIDENNKFNGKISSENKSETLILKKEKSLNTNFFNSSNIIQNLVNFREIGFKNKKDFLLEQFQVIINRSKKIQVKVWYFLQLLTCGKLFNTEENILIQKARSYAQKDLDIYIILDKLQEVEKIKKILLNENQLTLFNFSQKPLIQKNDQIYNAVSLRNLQIKLRKSESQSGKNKTNSSSNNLYKQTLFCEKLQFDNIEAYEKLHKAYENIQPFQLQDKVSRQLIKEIGTELREIFELSKIIEKNADFTPKSTPLQKISSKSVVDLNDKQLDEFQLNPIKKKSIASRNNGHILDRDHIQNDIQAPSRNLYINECSSPEEKPVDEAQFSNRANQIIKNPYSFISSSNNKPARLSIFNNLKGVLVQQEEQDNNKNKDESENSDSCSNNSSVEKTSIDLNKTQKEEKINEVFVDIQEDYLDSEISQREEIKNEKFMNENIEIQQNELTAEQNDYEDLNKLQINKQNDQNNNKTNNQNDFNIAKSFKMNLTQIQMNQSLFLQDIDISFFNESSYKTISDNCILNDIQKEATDHPIKPLN